MVSISGSAHLQGRHWADMSGWSEGSEDKGEVCVRCGGWVELGPISHSATHHTCRVQMAHTNTHTQHTHTTHTGEHTTPTNLLVPAPPSSSSQVMASLGSPLHPWPPRNIPSECPHRHMMCQVMVQHLTCILGVGGVDV